MRYILLLLMCFGTIIFSRAQSIHSAGIGYFGETLTYKGVVMEYEFERIQSQNVSLVFRSDAGFYNHPRNHQAFFVDQHIGVRRNLNSHLFTESAIGIGVMLPRLNSPVYRLNDQGELVNSRKFLDPDFMPSITLGIGYDFDTSSNRNAIWLRPKMFWQYPYNTLPLPHVAVQLGFSHTIKSK